MVLTTSVLNSYKLFKLGFNPTEQPLQGIWSYKERKHKKIKAYRKFLYKEPTVNRCLLILDLRHLDYRSKESIL